MADNFASGNWQVKEGNDDEIGPCVALCDDFRGVDYTRVASI